MSEKIHQGKNIRRFREMLGVNQDTLAATLGDDWTQKKVSLLEQKEVIEADLLEQVAKALKVPADAIKNFDEQVALNIISNTFNENAFINSPGTFNINAIDKWLEALEEIKKLNAALLKEKDEKIELLEKILAGKK